MTPILADTDREMLEFLTTVRDLLVIGFLIVLPPLALEVILKRRRDLPGRRRWPEGLRKLILWFYATIVVVSLPVGQVAGLGYGPLLCIIVAAMLVRYFLVRRHGTAEVIFSALAGAMRQNLPLPAALAAEGSSWKAGRKKKLLKITHHLEQGLPLSRALEKGYPECPGFALGLIAAAEPIHQLPQALAKIEAQLARKGRKDRDLRPVDSIYPLAFLLVALGILTLLAIYVIPKFKQIFLDMRVDLPEITRTVFGLCMDDPGALVPILGIAALVTALYLSFRPRYPQKPYLLSRVGDFFRWHLPVCGWFERNGSIGQAVSFLRLSLATGATVDRAIDGAMQLDLNQQYRRRLGRWLRDVQAGQDIAAAARRCGVGKSLAWAMDSRANPDCLAALGMLESFYQSRYSYLANLVRVTVVPCVTIALGLLVAVVAYALFLPMALMIQHNSSMIP